MAAKQKPYDQYGPFILFKKLESDSLGDLWRAARIESSGVSTTVALRRLTGGNREALLASANTARQVAPLLTGPSFARNQSIDIVNGVVCISHDYSGGRSLRHIIDRARGGPAMTPNPLPIDQAIVILEKVALSLATVAELRFSGERLSHGGLLPHFVWISDDGEIRVAAQQLGKGLVASLKDAKVGAELGRYFSPEYRHSGEMTKASEVYSLGALLFLAVTGQEPPDASTTSAFASSIRAAKTMAGAPIPDEVRALLEKSLNLDPAMRFPTVADMKNALSGVSAKYGATSFNLAFYLSTLLKKEFEGEAADREREAKVDVAPYVEALLAPPVAAVAAAPAAPSAPSSAPFAAIIAAEQKKKSKAPIAIAAALALAVIGGGAYFVLGSKKAAPVAPSKLASTIPVPAKKPAPAIPDAIVASVPQTTSAATATTTATPGAMDEAAKKKAFEDAVNQKLHEEMMKLQSEYTKSLQQQQSKNAPVVPAPAAPATVASTATHASSTDEMSASQLDQQRRESERTTTVAQQPGAGSVQQLQTAAAAVTPAQVAAAPAAPVVHEGDIINFADLDVAPTRTREPRIVYPPMAQRQRIQTAVMTSVLVSETGDVLDVKILRGDSRFGFDDAAVRALKGAKYTPATKDGKRVKVWLPQMVRFKLE